MKRKFSSIAILVLATWLLLEAGSYVLMKSNISHAEIPTFSWSRKGAGFFRDVPEAWATWHLPNSSSRHVRTCFDYQYQFNSEGMRDKPRERQGSESRVVVLGDSFVEGWGARDGERFTDLLESAKGREFLNFGGSSFGPLQFYLIYEHLAKFFTHDNVLVGIFPTNDFDDDNIELWRNRGRRRPFWVGQAPDYALSYTKAKPKTFFQRNLRPIFKEFSYFYNAAEDGFDRIKALFDKDKEALYSRYYDFTEEELQRMLFSLQKLRDASQGKKLTFVLFPAVEDLKRYDRDGKSPLVLQLEAWGRERDVTVIDLLPYFHDSRKDWATAYSLPCDGHWGSEGHRTASELVQKYF